MLFFRVLHCGHDDTHHLHLVLVYGTLFKDSCHKPSTKNLDLDRSRPRSRSS